jgi:chromosomal replication initiator protein
VDICGEYFGLTSDSLRSKSREKAISNARHYAIYLAREILDISYSSIARYFNRKHSSIIHSYKVIANGNNELILKDIRTRSFQVRDAPLSIG